MAKKPKKPTAKPAKPAKVPAARKPAAKAGPAKKAATKQSPIPSKKAAKKVSTKSNANAEPKAGPKVGPKVRKKVAKNAVNKGTPKVVAQAVPSSEAPGPAEAAQSSAPSKPAKLAKPAKPAKAARPPSPKRRKPAAEPVLTEASGRPVSKVHVHAGGEMSEAVRGRARTPAGPAHAGISDDAVRASTGRGWEEWLALLDGEGAVDLEHKAIVAVLRDKHELDDWWSQMVTVGYEQARGKREKHQKPDGFHATMSKTINAPVGKLFLAWADESTRERWLGDSPIEIRVANPDKNIRITWLAKGPDEGSSVEVYFWPKDGNRGLVQVEQRKLADAAAVQRVKAFWSIKLENLRSVMEKPVG